MVPWTVDQNKNQSNNQNQRYVPSCSYWSNDWCIFILRHFQHCPKTLRQMDSQECAGSSCKARSAQGLFAASNTTQTQKYGRQILQNKNRTALQLFLTYNKSPWDQRHFFNLRLVTSGTLRHNAWSIVVKNLHRKHTMDQKEWKHQIHTHRVL